MYHIDLRKSILPFSLLEVCKQVKRMTPGETLEVVGDSPDILLDLCRILTTESVDIGPVQVIHDADIEYRLKIRKIKHPPNPNQGGTSCLTSI